MVREWWQRCSTDIEFLRDQQTKFFAANGIEPDQEHHAPRDQRRPGHRGQAGLPRAGHPGAVQQGPRGRGHPGPARLQPGDGEGRWAPPTASGAPGVGRSRPERPLAVGHRLRPAARQPSTPGSPMSCSTTRATSTRRQGQPSRPGGGGAAGDGPAAGRIGRSRAWNGLGKATPQERSRRAQEAKEAELQRMLDEYTQKVWTAEELATEAVMLEDGPSSLSCRAPGSRCRST
jgi:hypothetical protein